MSTLSRAIVNLTRRVVTSSSTFTRMPHSFSRHLTPLSQLPISANKFNSIRFASNATDNKREQELAEFLVTEIELEKDSQKQQLPKMAGWTVSHDGSDVTFVKKHNNEEITIKANVCYSVDAANPEAENGQMVCKPDFAIEIKKGDVILGLNCSFIQEDENMQEENQQKLEDDFQINEISVYEGEFEKNSYAVSGDVIDGNLYDMMINVLEDRGIDQQFAKSLIEYATVYEHGQYVNLLENLKKFFSN